MPDCSRFVLVMAVDEALLLTRYSFFGSSAWLGKWLLCGWCSRGPCQLDRNHALTYVINVFSAHIMNNCRVDIGWKKSLYLDAGRPERTGIYQSTSLVEEKSDILRCTIKIRATIESGRLPSFFAHNACEVVALEWQQRSSVLEFGGIDRGVKRV